MGRGANNSGLLCATFKLYYLPGMICLAGRINTDLNLKHNKNTLIINALTVIPILIFKNLGKIANKMNIFKYVIEM